MRCKSILSMLGNTTASGQCINSRDCSAHYKVQKFQCALKQQFGVCVLRTHKWWVCASPATKQGLKPEKKAGFPKPTIVRADDAGAHCGCRGQVRVSVRIRVRVRVAGRCVATDVPASAAFAQVAALTAPTFTFTPSSGPALATAASLPHWGHATGALLCPQTASTSSLVGCWTFLADQHKGRPIFVAGVLCSLSSVGAWLRMW